MRIVTDGEKYAVKRGYWFWAEFLSLTGTLNWRMTDGCIEEYCWGTKEQAIAEMNKAKLEEQKEKNPKPKKRKHWDLKEEK